MKHLNLTARILLMAGILVNSAYAEEYVIDTRGTHAFIQFKTSHLGYSYIIGGFNDFEGTFSYDSNNPDSSFVSVIINARSVDTNHAERDRHLKSEDFFDVDTYPEITFTSTSFQEMGDDEISVTGNLDFHGITKQVTLIGNHVGYGKDPWGGYRRGLEASTSLEASDFDLPSWIGEVEIYVVVEGIRQ